MTKLLLGTIVAAAAVLGSQSASAQVVVVAGAKSPASNLTAEQAANLFLGKQAQLPGAGNAVLYDQPDGSPAREQFYTKVAGKSAAQVKAAWSRLVFSGKATPPKEVAGDDQVKKALSNNPDAVGYIDKSAVDGSVKVLLSVD